jgi:excinuclease ABC subunit B
MPRRARAGPEDGVAGRFTLKSPQLPRGDQPRAIESLGSGLSRGLRSQVMHGATGTGKTFVIAKVIEEAQRPALIVSHNKTLAAQLTSELRDLFPDSAVEYFVSHYDYYRPEAYVPEADFYIQKDADVNREIEVLRHRATQALLSRRDVIVVSSVSCIYGIGSPDAYREESVKVERGQRLDRDHLIETLAALRYERTSSSLSRGQFRARGDVVEICGPIEDVTRIEFFDDIVERVQELDPVGGTVSRELPSAVVFPTRHFVTPKETREEVAAAVSAELEERLGELRKAKRLVEAQRLEERTRQDVELIRELGYCPGVENYSRYFGGHSPGSAPSTLLDFFPRDYVMVIDESHVTVPQIQGMHRADRARKETLVEHGFRLKSALDNRPLRFAEFEERMPQTIFMSATPAEYERKRAAPPGGQLVELIIRPTGLVDPEVEVRKRDRQVEDSIAEIKARAARGERSLATTLTKRAAELLARRLEDAGVKVHYLHSDVETIKRVEILRDLRLGKYDCVAGVNLLREGLDLPEVSLVAILDADRAGFLRSETSLIQTIGRAARHVAGRVLMYCDSPSAAMQAAIRETERRRALQIEYNRAHGIEPQGIRKAVRSILDLVEGAKGPEQLLERSRRMREGGGLGGGGGAPASADEREAMAAALEEEMRALAAELRFEEAARVRDEVRRLRGAPPLRGDTR